MWHSEMVESQITEARLWQLALLAFHRRQAELAGPPYLEHLGAELVRDLDEAELRPGEYVLQVLAAGVGRTWKGYHRPTSEP